MHKFIGRRIVTTVCHYKRLNPDNDFEDFVAVINGSYTEKQATKHLRRIENDLTIVVYECEYESAYYKMSIDDFINNSIKEK